MKICSRCDTPKDDSEFRDVPAWGTRKARKDSWCKTCRSTHSGEYSLAWAAAHRVEKRAYDKARAMKIREEVITAYGGKCACCGDTHHQFLSVDHKDGDGNEHRRADSTAIKIYEWLKKHSFPKEGFQLLCFNCNCARGFFGFCCIPPEIISQS